MCVEVRWTDTTTPRWDRDNIAIEVPEDLTYGQTLLVIREILTQLGAEQPTMEMRAVCFCGDPVIVRGLTVLRRHAPANPRLLGVSFLEVSRGA